MRASEARTAAPDNAILIVEDTAAAGAALRRAVESHGHPAVVVRDGADAIREAVDHSVALALVAIGSRHAKGVDLVAELRRLPDPPEVIVISGRADRASALAAVESGAGYLVRPVDTTRLGAIIRRVIDHRRTAREHTRLFEQGDQERRRLHALYEVSRRVAAVADTDQILSLLVNEAKRLLDADAAGIRLLEGDDLVLGARSEDAAEVMARDRIKVGESLSGKVVATGEPIAVRDLADDTRFDPGHKQGAVSRGYHGFLGVPLRLGGGVIGAIVLFTRQRRDFTGDEVSLLSAFADHAALALHKARLLQEAEEGRHLVERLYRVAVSMQDSWAPADRLDAFIKGTQEAVGFDRIYVFLANEDGDLHIVTKLSEGEAPPPARLPLSPAAGPFFQVVQSRKALVVLQPADLASVRPLAPAYRSHPFFRSRRFVIAPLVVGQRVLGVVGADNKRTRRPIPPASVEPLVLLCQQLATALEEARLYAESRSREEEASALYGVTRTLASSLDPDEVLDGVAQRAVELLGSDASAIYLWEESRGGLVFRRGLNLDTALAESLVLRPGEGVAGRAFAERRAVWTRDRLTDTRLDYGSAAREILGAGLRAYLAVPIESRGEMLGVLMGHFRTVHEFTSKEVQLLSTLADQAAIAIEHARHYDEAHTQQTRLTQIFDSTSDGIILLGRSGRVEAANRKAGEFLTFDPTTALGLPLSEVLATHRAAIADYDRTCDTLTALAAEPDREAEGDFELRAIGRTLHWAARPTRSAAGAAVGLTLTFQDVTHEREVSQMKSDFVSFVTHQLRTPLSGIKWMLELAAQEPELPGEVGSYIQDGRDAAQRLIELVNDLLDVSRLEHGRLTVVPQDVPIGEVTRAVLGEVDHLARDKGHRVIATGLDDAPAVVADPQLLRQVVLNLVSNAIKYTPQGGDIVLAIAPEETEVRWSVTDSGIGVPAGAHARLFEKFYRADNVTTVETEGTGLGLYLVRLIIERFGGRVWCESEEGRGATFCFTLPLGGR
jgi:PAS domain S-box-containing protein